MFTTGRYDGQDSGMRFARRANGAGRRRGEKPVTRNSSEDEATTVNGLRRSIEVRRRCEPRRAPARACGAGIAAAIGAAGVGAWPASAHASFLPPELMDTAAFALAWFVLIFVPIGLIVLFWMVHVLPEKIAHKRHHPQRDAIQVLCLLSLVFGGLLWPIAWLWAYVKPVTYKLAYGTEKHEDYFHELGAKAQAGELLEHELKHLRDELDTMASKGALTPRLRQLRKELETVPAAASAPGGPVAVEARTGNA